MMPYPLNCSNIKLQQIVILGSTGSIGNSTLDVIRQHQDLYQVFALTANSNVDKLLQQCIEFKPTYAVILDQKKAIYLQDALNTLPIPTKVLCSTSDLLMLVQHEMVDIVMAAIVGSAGLLPTYHAISASKKVLLANKESLVVGGKFIIEALKNSTAQLIPVDSEHSAIFQCLAANDNFNEINKIILTASGGPFRTLTKTEVANVTPESALKHPNWVMGSKITIDCSTLMNKGLELIEAYWLFGQKLDLLDVIVHPQSIIHSMVEYLDGSVLAQLGSPDMKTPIAYALSYPNRITSGSERLDLTKTQPLTFEAPDHNKFPCLNLAYAALRGGGILPAVLNAANEVAVAAFLNKQIKFYGINNLIENAMQKFGNSSCSSIEELIEVDSKVHEYALNLCS